MMKSQISSSVIEVAIVTVTDLLTALMIKPVKALVTKPVNGIYEFGSFEVDRFP